MNSANPHMTPQIRAAIDVRADAWIQSDPQPIPARQEATGDVDFIDHIMTEHDQFIALLERARDTLAAFLTGANTLGTISRLADDIAAALPATMPTLATGGEA